MCVWSMRCVCGAWCLCICVYMVDSVKGHPKIKEVIKGWGDNSWIKHGTQKHGFLCMEPHDWAKVPLGLVTIGVLCCHWCYNPHKMYFVSAWEHRARGTLRLLWLHPWPSVVESGQTSCHLPARSFLPTHYLLEFLAWLLRLLSLGWNDISNPILSMSSHSFFHHLQDPCY